MLWPPRSELSELKPVGDTWGQESVPSRYGGPRLAAMDVARPAVVDQPMVKGADTSASYGLRVPMVSLGNWTT